VGCHKPVTSKRGEAGKADRGGCRGREDSSRGERGCNVLQLLSKIGDKAISCEGRGGDGGLRMEKHMEKRFLGLEAEGLIFAR